MSEAQGPNIAEWQAQQQHQEAASEKVVSVLVIVTLLQQLWME